MIFTKIKIWILKSKKLLILIIMLITFGTLYLYNRVNYNYFSKVHAISQGTKAAAQVYTIDSKGDPSNLPIEELTKFRKASNEAAANSTKVQPAISNMSVISKAQNQKPQNKPLSGFKALFNNDAFLGDSITEGLYGYKFLEDANVCAEIGSCTSKVKSFVDKAVKINPEKVFILCGINDIAGNISKKAFASSYTDLIQTVKEKLPRAAIYIQSILPVMPQAEEISPYVNNSHINEFNTVLMEIAQSENIRYLNVASLLNDNNKSLYESDGLHYKATFYPLWLNYLAENSK